MRELGWMRRLPNQAPLTELTLPGTHASAARHDGTVFDDASVARQRLSIHSQLEFGIRFLDISLRPSGASLVIHRGSAYQRLSFGDVTRQISLFLRSFPSEVVLVRVRQDPSSGGSTRSFNDLLQSYHNQHRELFWSPGNVTPTLGETRGKVVLVAGDTEPEGLSVPLLRKVQDQRTEDILQKITAVETHVRAALRDPFCGYLNVLAPTVSLTRREIRSAAAQVNMAFASLLDTLAEKYPEGQRRPRLGVIAMDFPDLTSNIIEKIIRWNIL